MGVYVQAMVGAVLRGGLVILFVERMLRISIRKGNRKGILGSAFYGTNSSYMRTKHSRKPEITWPFFLLKQNHKSRQASF